MVMAWWWWQRRRLAVVEREREREKEGREGRKSGWRYMVLTVLEAAGVDHHFSSPFLTHFSTTTALPLPAITEIRDREGQRASQPSIINRNRIERSLHRRKERYIDHR